MTAQPQPTRRSGVELRFAQLAICVIAAAVFAYNSMYYALPDRAERFADASSDCQVRAAEAYINFDPASGDYDQMGDVMGSCLRVAQAEMLVFVLLAVTALLLAALTWYWLTPTFIRQRNGFVPLQVERIGGLEEKLTQLTEAVGVRARPRFVWNPAETHVRALAFGHVRQRYVAVSMPVIAGLLRDDPTARAIVLHELGHIANQDLDLAYLAVTLWNTFVALVLIPWAFSLWITEELPRSVAAYLPVAWRVVAFAVIVLALRNAVLRHREHAADLVASSVDGPIGLERGLGAEVGSRELIPLRSTHPSGADRLRMIRDPLQLLRVDALQLLALGLACGLALPAILSVALMAVRGDYAQLAAALLAGAITAVIVELTLVRGASAPTPVSSLRLGLAFAVGFVIGPTLAISGAADTPGPSASAEGAFARSAYELLFTMLAVALLALFITWCRTTAGAWLDQHASWPAAIGAGVVLSALLAWIFRFGLLGQLFADAKGVDGVVVGLTFVGLGFLIAPMEQSVWGLMLVTALWATPLAPALWPRVHTADVRARLRATLRTAVRASAVVVGLLLVKELVFGRTDSAALATLQFVGEIAVLLLGQAGMGFIVGRAGGAQPVAYALLASAVTAVLATTGYVVVALMLDRPVGMYLPLLYAYVINAGAVTTLVGCALGRRLARAPMAAALQVQPAS